MTNALRIGLVACCQKKASGPCLARELYQSDLFKKSLAVSEATNTRTFILSAKYGLVLTDQVVEPYDAKLCRADAEKWAEAVAARLLDLVGQVDPLEVDITVPIYAGEAYATPVIEALCRRAWPVLFELPLKGMEIGRRLQWLKARLANQEGRQP